MDEHQEITNRLRRFGAAPVDPALSRTTLEAMHVARPGVRRHRRRVAIAAAAIAGFFAGSFGLVSAGALPAGLQDTAQSVLEHVGVDVPPGHVRYNDPVVCPGGPYKNHGEYVRTHKDDPNAGASPCGKPVSAVNGTESDGSESEAPDASESDDVSSDPGHGNGKGKTKDKSDEQSDTDTGATAASDSSESASEAPASESSEPAPETHQSTQSSS